MRHSCRLFRAYRVIESAYIALVPSQAIYLYRVRLYLSIESGYICVEFQALSLYRARLYLCIESVPTHPHRLGTMQTQHGQAGGGWGVGVWGGESAKREEGGRGGAKSSLYRVRL